MLTAMNEVTEAEPVDDRPTFRVETGNELEELLVSAG